VRAALICLIACGGSEAIAPTKRAVIGEVARPPTPPPRPCAATSPDQIGEWRYALVTEPFDPVEDVTHEQLFEAWSDGSLAAAPDTIAALAPALGDPSRVARLMNTGRAEPRTTRRAIVPAHELSPAWKPVTIDGAHPLTGASPLAVPLCGVAQAAVRNIDPDKLSTVVISGTTALTRRTAERIESHSAQDLVRHIAPWFRSADITHVSNEVAFLRDCDPEAGPSGDPMDLIFCSKDRYIEVLEAIGTDVVELTGSHLSDYGSRTLLRTIEMYRKRGWVWFGGGRTQLEAAEPRLIEHHGNRFAFVGCNAVGTWLHAVSKGAGVAACDWPRMTWEIRDLRRRGLLPIVSVQHQETHEHDVPPGLVTDLRRLAEAGAMVVLGSQAHSAHPWDVHHGAYVHYGPGNILFAQSVEAQREASVDKLYVHAGRLLAVEKLYTRTEHGQPRPLTDRERARFLRQMAKVAADLPPADPWIAPIAAETDRVRPDSLIVDHGRVQQVLVRMPERMTSDRRYPLVVDLMGGFAYPDDAFVVAPIGKVRATGPEIAGFIHAKYPVDPDRTSISEPAKPTKKRRSRRR